ncbi:MAG: hypothetical protein R3C40_06400 [Parvularculaceae bacterium]
MAYRTYLAALAAVALAAAALAMGGVHAEETARLAPADDINNMLGVGWLKTFPYKDGETALIAPGAAIVIPDVQETVLERAVRTELSDMLAARGFALFAHEEDAGDGALVLSLNVEVANEFKTAPPQSPLRFGPSLSDPVRDNRFRTAEPPPRSIDYADLLDYVPLYWDSYIKHKKDRRSVSMTVYLYNDGERLWGGFAAAEIGPKGRTALARAMAVQIAENLGGSVDQEPAAFVAGARAPATIPPVEQQAR